jgi:hypothetical protein
MIDGCESDDCFPRPHKRHFTGSFVFVVHSFLRALDCCHATEIPTDDGNVFLNVYFRFGRERNHVMQSVTACQVYSTEVVLPTAMWELLHLPRYIMRSSL